MGGVSGVFGGREGEVLQFLYIQTPDRPLQRLLLVINSGNRPHPVPAPDNKLTLDSTLI